MTYFTKVGVLVCFVCLYALVGCGVEGAPLTFPTTTQDFWEPLPFATLPVPLETRPIFWQDSSVQGKILTIGGNIVEAGGFNFNVTNAVFQLDVATERWTQLTLGGEVFTPRTFHTALLLVNNSAQYVAVYGGARNVQGTLVPIQDFALLDLSTLTWKNMGMPADAYEYYYGFTDMTCCETCPPDACPPPRINSKGVTFDYDLTTMYMYGGISNLQVLEDFWKYSIVTNTWTKLNITNSITPARASGAVQALSRSTTKRIVFFSGFYIGSVKTLSAGNDLWLLEEVSLDVWTWTKVMPVSLSGPPERSDPITVIVDSLMFMWGGTFNSTGKKRAGPMWVLDTTQSDYTQWAWQSLPAPVYEPIPLAGSGLVYINSTRTLTSIGGSTNASLGNTPNLYRFHPISLLPPITTVLPDVPNGFDFNLDPQTTHVFNNGATSPDFQVRSRQTSAAVLSTSFGQLVEMDPLGNPVTSFDLSPSNGFVLLYNRYDPREGFKVTVFNRYAVPGTLAPGVSSTNHVNVRFEFYQYDVDTNVNALPPGSTLPPQNFVINGGRLKFNVRVSNWPFASSANDLVLSMAFGFPSAVTVGTRATYFGTAYDFRCAEGNTTFNLLSDSVNDGNVLKPVTSSVTLSTSTTADLRLTFKSFTDNTFYDPDLGVVVSPSNSDDSGSGSNDDWVIAVAVVVPVVVVGAFIIFAVLLTAVLINARRVRVRNRSATKMITFGDETDAIAMPEQEEEDASSSVPDDDESSADSSLPDSSSSGSL